MNGIEAGTAAGRSEMERQSAAEGVNRRARGTGLKVDGPVAGGGV